MRQVNDEALALLKQWEGLVLYAYDDQDTSRPPRPIREGDHVAGQLTIGYGHTRTTKPGMKITAAQAERLLRADLAEFERAVSNGVTVDLTDNQFSALVSFAFNVGADAFRKSTLLRRLNAGDYAAVPAQLARWNKDNGRVVKGLVNRRAAEAGLWARGSFVASNTVPAAPAPVVPPAVAAGGAGVVGIGGVAAAAQQAAPVLQAIQGIDWKVVGLVIAAAGIGALVMHLLHRRQPA